MTPEERTNEVCKATGYEIACSSDVAVIINKAIRAAENDAIERAAGRADEIAARNNTGSGFDSQPAYSTAWKIATQIRALKS